MKRRRGQVFVEYGVLLALVIFVMIIFVHFLSRAVEQKTNTFEDELVIKHQ